MANEYDEPRIPGLNHSFKRLIERLPEEDLNASRKELKRRIRNVIGLPQKQDDPFGDELEASYLGASRTRRQPRKDRTGMRNGPSQTTTEKRNT